MLFPFHTVRRLWQNFASESSQGFSVYFYSFIDSLYITKIVGPLRSVIKWIQLYGQRKEQFWLLVHIKTHPVNRPKFLARWIFNAVTPSSYSIVKRQKLAWNATLDLPYFALTSKPTSHSKKDLPLKSFRNGGFNISKHADWRSSA